MLVNGLRIALRIALAMTLVYAGASVDRWYRDSVTLEKVGPEAEQLRGKRDELVSQVSALESTNATLREQISKQNHTVELAQAETNSIKAQQEMARTFAAKLEAQKSKRIAQLEADLADATKTVTDLLDNNWRQPR